MIHPLAEDLSKLKDNEVELKLQELTKKYFQAQRLGNHALLTQLSTFVTMYKEEMAARYRRNVNNATNMPANRDLNQLINVE